MIARAVVLLVLVVALPLIAWLNPPPSPQVPTATRWVKIDGQGEQLPAWGGPWKCVLDTEQGLLWEVKSYVEDLHDYQCSFSWYDGKTGVARGGDCFNTGTGADTSDLIRYANAEKRCGVGNWRLPTESELRTLLIDNPRPGAPHIAEDYFPYTKRGPHWSSDMGKPLSGHYGYLKEGAAAVDSGTGISLVLPYSNTSFVRIVADAEQ